MTPKFLYLTEADLFRVGNAESPKLDDIRASDVDTFDLNGLRMVLANGKGISLLEIKSIAGRNCASL